MAPYALNCSLGTIHCLLDLHVLRKRARPRNRSILLWLTVLQLRLEHLAERGPDECEISFVIALHVLREQPGEIGGSGGGRDN